MQVSGVISSESREGLTPIPARNPTIKEELGKAAKDERVKAIVLRIKARAARSRRPTSFITN